MEVTNFLFFAFGSHVNHNRAALAIYSLLINNPWINRQNSNLIIYTECIEYFTDKLSDVFSKTNFVLEYLSEERMTDMKGPLNFVHRIKICLIEETLIRYGSNLIYLDSDMLVVSDLSEPIKKLQSGNTLMHAYEYPFSLYEKAVKGSIEKMFFDFYSTTPLVINERDYSYTQFMMSYNAGVVGLSIKQLSLLSDVYKVTDILYAHVKHHACEQFAFSMVFETQTELYTCDAEIYHYWHSVKKKIVDENFDMIFHSLMKDPTSDKILELKRHVDEHFEWNKWLLFHFYDARKYDKGDRILQKVLVSNPFRGLQFYKDILYHMRRRFLTKNRKEPIGFSPF